MEDGAMRYREVAQEMVAAFRVDCKEIFEKVKGAPEGAVLETVEFEVRRRAFTMYARLLERALRHRHESRPSGRAPQCPCGRRMRMAHRQGKTVVTVLGEMDFRRRYYSCDGCGQSRVPFDEEVGLDRSSYSTGARRLISRCGSAHSFEEARRALAELAGLRVSTETVRQVTEQVAHEVEAVGAGPIEPGGGAWAEGASGESAAPDPPDPRGETKGAAGPDRVRGQAA
jgi:hypothetical protein